MTAAPTRGPRHLDVSARPLVVILNLAVAALMIWSSYLHYHLWHDLGYRNIPHIGRLFLAQAVAGVVLALLTLSIRRLWVAVIALGFFALTMASFLVAVTHGLLGFHESWQACDAVEAFAVESGAILVLALLLSIYLAATPTRRQR